MFYEILDKKRLKILPFFKQFKREFYLAGGTALALQIGHRDSIDFDFFTPNDIDTAELFRDLKRIFISHELKKTQEEKNTLSVLIDEEIRCSFFTYPYGLVRKAHDEENFRIASIEDIGCMKLSAITGRASNKDYIDLYFILKTLALNVLLELTEKKLPDLDLNLVLKSLVYFEDVREEPILYTKSRKVAFKTVKDFLKAIVQKAKYR